MRKYFDGYASFDWNEMSNQKLIVELKEKCRYIAELKQIHKEEISTIQSSKDRQINDLQTQLAEKEKELTYMTKQAKKFNNEAQKYYEDAYCNDNHNQDKISFAIEQLEKVKDWCENHKFSDEDDYVIAYEPDEEDASDCVDYLKEEINKQIKQLKDGK